MGSFYCLTAQQIIQNSPPPGGVNVSIVEYPQQQGAVYIRLYANDLFMLKEKKVEDVALWLQALLDKLNSLPLMGKYSYEISIEEPKINSQEGS